MEVSSTGMAAAASETRGDLLRAIVARPEIFAAMFEVVPSAIAVLEGPEHRYVMVNPALVSLARGREPLIGRTAAEVWPEVSPVFFEALGRVFRTGEAFEAAEQPFEVQREHGRETAYLSVVFTPLRGVSGATERILVVADDVSDQVLSRRAAQERAARLEASYVLTAALSSAHTRAEVARAVFDKGFATFGAAAGALAVLAAGDPELVELVESFGYPGPVVAAWQRFRLDQRAPLTDAIRFGEPVWVASWAEAKARYPDWAPVIVAGQGQSWAALPLHAGGRAFGALGLTFSTEGPLDVEYRSLLLSVSGRCAQALDRARALDEASRHAAELRAFFDANAMGVIFGDIDGHVHECNDEAARLLGCTLQEVRADKVRWDEVTPPEDLPLDERAIAEAQVNGRAAPYEKRYRWRDGTEVWIQVAFILLEPDRRRTVAFILDITEKKRIEGALLEADQRKDHFLALLSHELRNPLGAMGASLAVLHRAAPGSDMDRRARGVLERQTGQLARLVDELLDVTRIREGKIELSLARVDACDLVRRACDEVRAAFAERRVALSVDVDATPAWVQVDAARVSQMIGNLLGNALKFTPPGQRVEVTARARGATVAVTVRDTGAGIAAGDLDRIFEPFVQAERTRDVAHGGLGLGLPLVRELAKLHGGTVRGSSGGVGHGAEFVIELPLAQGALDASAVDGPARDPEPRAPARALRASPLDGPASSPKPRAPAGAAVPGAEAAGLSVLVVDDNEDAGEMLSELLKQMGHAPRVSLRGQAAIVEISRDPPDLLICDIGLPDVSGHEVVRAVRRLPQASRVIAVALTGYAQPGDREEALSAGFDGHLTKPLEVRELSRLLALARARKES